MLRWGDARPRSRARHLAPLRRCKSSAERLTFPVWVAVARRWGGGANGGSRQGSGLRDEVQGAPPRGPESDPEGLLRRFPAGLPSSRRGATRCVRPRALFVLALSFGTLARGASLPEGGHVRPVSPVQVGTLPGPPDAPLDVLRPDMGRVWDAAITRDPWPDLATTRGRTGTLGGKIALTFDDGPDPRTTPLILDTLREHDLKATFFVVGRRVAQNPGLLRRIVEEGHTIGNHTYYHADMSRLSPKEMRRELRSTQKAVDDALGHHHRMTLMRPPYGSPYLGGADAMPSVSEGRTGAGALPRNMDRRPERLPARQPSRGRGPTRRSRGPGRAKKGKRRGGAPARHPQADGAGAAGDHSLPRGVGPEVRGGGRVARR